MKDRLKFKPKRPKPTLDSYWFQGSPSVPEGYYAYTQKERITMQLTDTQKLEVIRRGAEKGYYIFQYHNDDWLLSQFCKPYIGNHPTYAAALLALAHIVCPEYFAPRWQDDEGWWKLRRDCEEYTNGQQSDCPFYNSLSGCVDCRFHHFLYPCYRAWQPPINPATNEPYLTLSEWEADNPVKPQLRDMTELEKGYVKGMCSEYLTSKPPYDCNGCAIKQHAYGKGGCPSCHFIDNRGFLPRALQWQPPQVPVDFSVEG